MSKAFHFLLALILVQPLVNATGSAKPTITITSQASFHREGVYGVRSLVLYHAKHPYFIQWEPHGPSITLKTNGIYTFTIIPDDSKNPEPLPLFFKRSRVVKIEQDGTLIYDREVCEVHHIQLEHRVGWIVYTYIFPAVGEPPHLTEMRLFPHRKDYSVDLSFRDPGKLSKGDVYVCSECKKAYENWKSENQKAK